MDSDLEQKRWPTIANPADLRQIGEQIANAVRELEACWERGALNQPFVGDTRALLGPSIIEVYEKLLPDSNEELVRYRTTWVEAALQAFSFAWMSPLAVFPSDRRDADRHVVQHSVGETPMRSDQI